MHKSINTPALMNPTPTGLYMCEANPAAEPIQSEHTESLGNFRDIDSLDEVPNYFLIAPSWSFGPNDGG